MTQQEALESFGRLLVTSARDDTLFKFDAIAAGKMKSDRAMRLHRDLSALSVDQLEGVKRVIAGAIDDTIHNVLFMLEQSGEECELLLKNSAADQNLVEISDGLTGELYSEDGWITRFSHYASTE